ncbi:hypothetical protein ACH0B6_20275, partial [Solibacillus silvestris]
KFFIKFSHKKSPQRLVFYSNFWGAAPNRARLLDKGVHPFIKFNGFIFVSELYLQLLSVLTIGVQFMFLVVFHNKCGALLFLNIYNNILKLYYFLYRIGIISKALNSLL